MPDKRLDLILAYREAGLHDKADALQKELLAEALGKPALAVDGLSKVKTDLAQAGERLDAAVDNLADKLGLARPRRKRRPK